MWQTIFICLIRCFDLNGPIFLSKNVEKDEVAFILESLHKNRQAVGFFQLRFIRRKLFVLLDQIIHRKHALNDEDEQGQ